MLVRLSNFSSFQSVHVRLCGRAPRVVVARLYTFLQVDDLWLDEKVARLARMCMVFWHWDGVEPRASLGCGRMVRLRAGRMTRINVGSGDVAWAEQRGVGIALQRSGILSYVYIFIGSKHWTHIGRTLDAHWTHIGRNIGRCKFTGMGTFYRV